MHTVGLDERAEGVEEPPMTVELLLVLLLQAEDDLNRTCALRHFTLVRDDDMGSVPKVDSVSCGLLI